MDEATNYISFIKDSIEKIIAFKDSGLSNNLIINELNVKTNASSTISTLVKGIASIDSSLGSGIINPEKDYAEYDLINNIESSLYEGMDDDTKLKTAINALKGQFTTLLNILSDIKNDSEAIKDSLDKLVYDTNDFYKNVVNEIQKSASLIPPSGAIAGVYSQVDSDRGVWKAPANVKFIINICSMFEAGQ